MSLIGDYNENESGEESSGEELGENYVTTTDDESDSGSSESEDNNDDDSISISSEVMNIPSSSHDVQMLDLEPSNVDPDDEGLDVVDLEATTNNNPPQTRNPVVTSFPTWDGKRLYPPPASRSAVWEHGGFLKDRTGQLDKSEVICKHCGVKIKYSGSPTHLSKHVLLIHKINSNDMNSNKISQSKITDFSSGKSEVKKYSNTNPKQTKVKEKLVEWIVKRNRPFSVVEDLELREAFNVADPRIALPSATTIKSEIAKLEIKHTNLLNEELKHIDYVSCTNDAGSSYGGSGFIDVNIHGVNEKFELFTKILAVIPIN